MRRVLGWQSSGFYKFLFIAMLKEPMPLAELQTRCESIRISGDTVRDNVLKLYACGVLDKSNVKRSVGSSSKVVYGLREGAFCFGSFLLVTNPVIAIPCQHFVDCLGKEKCKLMDESSLMLGFKTQPVVRLDLDRTTRRLDPGKGEFDGGDRGNEDDLS
jgi:hypothetical protein